MASAVNSTPHNDVANGSIHELMIQAIMEWPAPRSEKISFHSRGSCLIFGPHERVSLVLELLPEDIRPISFSPDLPSSAVSDNYFPGTVISVVGHLGAYRAQARSPSGEQLDITPLSPSGNGLFDLVLDLGDNSLLSTAVKPLGYLHCANSDPGDVHRVVGRLADWLGDVNKPCYFNFNVQLCAHDRQGIEGCRRCLKACPTEAIRSEESRILIDPYLCQGCGTCSLVCPSGAVSHAYPGNGIIHQRLSQLIDGFAGMCNKAPAILFYEDDLKAPGHVQELDSLTPSHVLPFPLHSVASVGADTWFWILASGASQILVLLPPVLPKVVRECVSQQVDSARDLLRAVGLDPQRLRVVHKRDLRDLDVDSSFPLPTNRNSVEEMPKNKRSRLLCSLAKFEQPNINIPFTGGAALGLGSLELDAAGCTLCQACTHLCPASALKVDFDTLLFEPGRCVQCGLCVNGCPEHALELDQRYPLGRSGDAPVPLYRSVEQFECIQCGTPFADRKLVEKGILVLKGLPGYRAEQTRSSGNNSTIE